MVGNLSEFNLKLKEEGIIKSDIVYSIDNQKAKNDEFITVHIYAVSEEIDKYIKFLEERILSKDYNEELFNLYKKNIISDFNYDFNSVNGIMAFMTTEYEFEGKIDNSSIVEEMNLNYAKFVKVTDKLNLDNKSVVVMKKK